VKKKTMERFLDYVLRQLVEFPDEMVIIKEDAPKKTVFRLRLAPTDIGRIVGKGGSTIQALRNLLSASAAKKGEKVFLEIAE
jgi:uncharacterized protein